MSEYDYLETSTECLRNFRHKCVPSRMLWRILIFLLFKQQLVEAIVLVPHLFC